MRNNTVERVTEWESEPFTGGYEGLRELADREFTGAATDGHAWLFMLNGRVLGVFDGSMNSFDDADGTVYTAPDPALPLLFAMQETGGETRAEYYSEKTPISEASQTLKAGNFTGYIELSDNVLSGDYYIAYYGGRSLPAAFVGNSRELLTGDKAFDRADDEVGIYQVNTVDLEITDIPDDGSTSSPTPVETSDDTSSTESADTDTEDPAIEDVESDEPDTTASEPVKTTQKEEPEPTPEPEPEPAAASESEPDPAPKAAETEQQQPSKAGRAEREEADADESTSDSASRRRRVSSESPSAGSTDTDAESASKQQSPTDKWHGAKTIPALDPAESVEMADEVEADIDPNAGVEPAEESVSTQQSRTPRQSEALEELRTERDRLRERVEELEQETDRLEGEHDRLEGERDEAQRKVDGLEQEVEELRATVDRLETELQTSQEELAMAEQYAPEGDHEISAEEALEGTNLFVRYDRQGGPTLEDALKGNAERDDVNENIRLEHHTEFEDDGAIVEGKPFEEWLHETMEYGFARWLVQEFVHDIRETRNQSTLNKLYESIPEVDRVEFRGEVALSEVTEDAEEQPAEPVQFDVVLRDRMGNPLLVSDLNDSREPATESMLGTLLENTTPVSKASEGLASAFFVTASYYEPGALETAEEATGSGFLSRGKQKSFVKLSRTTGYHLCLVETREGEFHVSVPEL